MRRPTAGCPGAFLLGCASLAFLALSGCASSSQVARQTAELERLLSDHRDSLYLCAPKALARAEVEIALARHESSRGRPVSARAAVDRAQAAVREAWQGSDDRSCLPDSDGDGVPDREDRCPALPEDLDGFQDEDGCPDPDNDQDGVKDAEDACPLEAGVAANRGCPVLDSDQDGLKDPDDACPTVPGPLVNRGCPFQDADKDGVEDGSDRCPNEAGPATNDGCPEIQYKLITITEDRIQLRQKVFFQTGKAILKNESFGLLNEVAQAILDHPKFQVRIEGHTDSVGSDVANQRLSQSRADTVRRYLVGQGVAPDRLIAIGMGEEVPLDDNSTEAGRSVNRRVEFHILER